MEKKAWLGQWGHMYPDRPDEHSHLHWDFAETLLRWFDKYLKGVDLDTGPVVEVEDSANHWRAEAAWPPGDAAWTVLYTASDGELATEPGASGEALLYAPAGAALLDRAVATPVATTLTWTTPPFETGVAISGLPRFHVTVTPTSTGGHLYARLVDVSGDDATPVGRAQMDLRYAAGGESPAPVVPGVPLVVRMEFAPLDVRMAAGHALRLELTQETLIEPVASAETTPVVVQVGEGSTLQLPVVDRPFVPSRWDNPAAENVADGF